MPDPTHAALIADGLDARRSRILEDWRRRVSADTSLDEGSEWTRKQVYDHFPDVLEDFSQILRARPRGAPTAEQDRLLHAHAHARTRWLQGFSLRSVIREWGHFNSAVLAVLHALRGTLPAASEPALWSAVHEWARLANDQLAASALEYHRLQQAEAQTRADEMVGALDRLRELSEGRARLMGSMAEDLRAGLSVVMTSNSLMAADGHAAHAEHAELKEMSRSGVATLERSLADMVLLARLEAGQEARRLARFDAAQRLMLLASGLEHRAARLGVQFTWHGPESLPVEGDERQVGLIAEHLLTSGLHADLPGPLDLEWGDDGRSPERWLLLVRQHLRQTAEPSSPPISRVIAEATDGAQQAQGIPATGYEKPLQDGLIPVAARDGVNVLIAKHACELLDASIELEAVEGVVTYRVSLPRSYATHAPAAPP